MKNRPQPRISLIAALGKNREIGRNNRLLWHIPEDLKRFKQITSGCPVIMGKNTFESLPFVLPNRLNIVLTQDQDYQPKKVEAAGSIDQALKIARKENPREIFFIGGASVYQQALALADRLYITLIDQEFSSADTFFPDYRQFSRLISKKISRDKNYRYTFFILEK